MLLQSDRCFNHFDALFLRSLRFPSKVSAVDRCDDSREFNPIQATLIGTVFELLSTFLVGATMSLY